MIIPNAELNEQGKVDRRYVEQSQDFCDELMGWEQETRKGRFSVDRWEDGKLSMHIQKYKNEVKVEEAN